MLLKTPSEQRAIKQGGELMGAILNELVLFTRPGMSLKDIDDKAEELILKVGGVPAFKGYTTRRDDPPFPGTICASVNEELVHGIPRADVILKEGDIFSIDIGMEWPRRPGDKKRGYFTDTAVTIMIGTVDKEIERLLRVTQQALEVGIKAALPGKSVASIGRAIEAFVRSEGSYGIVRDLVGHGVGHAVHEDPAVPNYYDPALENIILKPGMVLALEPMISLSGETRVKTLRDGWTIVVADKSPCAHFEHTLIINRRGNTVVTRRPGELGA